MPIYMNWGATKPPSIKGDVTEADHVGWIELESAQFGVHRNINTPTGRGTNRDADVLPVSEIVVTKMQDSSSTQLYRMALWGEGKRVQIDFLKTDKGKSTAYLTLKLENVLIASYNVSGSGTGRERPMESLLLNFTKVEWGTVPAVTPHTNSPQWQLAP